MNFNVSSGRICPPEGAKWVSMKPLKVTSKQCFLMLVGMGRDPILWKCDMEVPESVKTDLTSGGFLPLPLARNSFYKAKNGLRPPDKQLNARQQRAAINSVHFVDYLVNRYGIWGMNSSSVSSLAQQSEWDCKVGNSRKANNLPQHHVTSVSSADLF